MGGWPVAINGARFGLKEKWRGGEMGSRLDEGRGRGGAAAWLLVVHRSGVAHNGGGQSNRRWRC
jgi:hypothetical protein